MPDEREQSRERVLALDIRPRASGFAILEAPARLLDWGTRKHRITDSDLAKVVVKKVSALFDLYSPSTVIVRARSVWSSIARQRLKVIMRIVRREAKKRSIPFHSVGPAAVDHFFAPYECTSKHKRATLIAGWFPELSSKLPSKRRAWKSEDYRMMVFDAMSAALAFLNMPSPAKK